MKDLPRCDRGTPGPASCSDPGDDAETTGAIGGQLVGRGGDVAFLRIAGEVGWVAWNPSAVS